MLEHIEQFSKTYEHAIALLTALGTVGAVIVSLALAGFAARATRTRLKADARMSVIMHSTIDPKNRPSYLTVHITNLGHMPLRIPFAFFSWKPPFLREYWTLNPMDAYLADDLIAQKKYPVEIAPRASQTLFLSDKTTFIDNVVRERGKRSWLGRLRLRFIRAVIFTDDGARFRAALSPQIRNFWAGRDMPEEAAPGLTD